MAGVRVVTAKKWSKDLDCLGEWLRYDELSGYLTCVYCELCTTHADSLRALCNFSPLFINGITGGVLKTLWSILKSDMHAKAVNLSKKPKTVDKIFRSTPIGRALTNDILKIIH